MAAVDAKAINIYMSVTGPYDAQIARSGALTQTFGNQAHAGMMKASSGMAVFGAKASKAATFGALAIAAGLALSAKAAIDFESSFAGVRKTVDASEARFRQLADSVRVLSTEIPIGVNELNRIMELGGQLGVETDDLVDFTETIAKIGVTTTLSTDQAAMGFARIDNIMQLGGKSFDRMGSTIVDLGNNFAATEDEILTFTLRIAPVGATVGMTTDEVIGLATAFTSVGVPAERGGTAVQKTIIKMAEAAQMGGIELETFAQTAGMTSEAFSEMFEDDPAYAFEAFVTGLGNIQEEGGNVFSVLDTVELSNQRVIASLLAMAGAEGVLMEALDMGAKAWGDNTALTEEAQKRFETTASALTILKNKIQDIAISIGSELLPAINDFLLGGEAIIDWVNDTENAFKNVGVALAGFTLALVAAAAHPVIAGLLAVGVGVWRIGVESDESKRQFVSLYESIKAANGELENDALKEYFQYEGLDTALMEKNLGILGYSFSDLSDAISGTDDEWTTFKDSFQAKQLAAGGIVIPIVYLDQVRGSFVDVRNEIESELAAAFESVDVNEQELWDRLSQSAGGKIRIKPEVVAAPLSDEQMDAISDALGEYGGVFAEAFNETDARIRDQIDLWYEWGDAVTINVEDIIASTRRQVAAIGAFESLIDETDMSAAAEAFIRQSFDTLPLMEALVTLRENSRGEFELLIRETEVLMGPEGELMAVILSAYAADFEGLEFKAGTDLVAKMKAIADEVAEDPNYNAAEAWKGVILGTLLEAGPAFAPMVIEALEEAFGSGGIPGTDQTIEDIEELARVLGLLPEVVDVSINVHTRFTETGTPYDPQYGAPFDDTGSPSTFPTKKAFGGSAFADEPYWVGELGPELFVPFNNGTIIPNKDLKSGGDRTTNIYIERTETNDLPGDISEGLTRASIVEQVDMIGAY